MIVDGKTTIDDGIVRLVFDSRCIKIIVIGEYDEPITLSQLLDMAIANGYNNKKSYNPLLILWENLTYGAVYRYSNFDREEWQKLGDLKGFMQKRKEI